MRVKQNEKHDWDQIITQRRSTVREDDQLALY